MLKRHINTFYAAKDTQRCNMIITNYMVQRVLEKLTVSQSRNSPPFREPYCSLSCSQESVVPQSDGSSPYSLAPTN